MRSGEKVLDIVAEKNVTFLFIYEFKYGQI